MAQDKTAVFESFAKAAAARLEERKKQRTEKYLIKSLGQEITLRGLSDAELSDCFDFSDNSLEVDKYTLYYASPTLHEAGTALAEQGVIKQPHEIADMFTGAERQYLVSQVLKLSGAGGKADIEPIKEGEEVKNS